MVLPTYSNDRLSKQNGVFLIATTFSVFEDKDYKNSIVKKSTRDLRDEFDGEFFYVNGDNKESILSELDSYGINESSLFPELEHQLRYIKEGNKKYTTFVESFNGYQKYERIENFLLPVDNKKLNSYILDKIYEFLIEFVDLKDAAEIRKIIGNNMVIDWYKKSSTSSKIKLEIKNYYSINKKDINSENLASKVLAATNELVKKYMEKSRKEED